MKDRVLYSKNGVRRDLERQVLSAEKSQRLHSLWADSDAALQWDEARVAFGRTIQKHLGLVDHHTASFNHYVWFDLQHHVRKMKHWTISTQDGRVHVFKIVQAYACPPHMLVSEADQRYAPMSAHEARLSNTAFEASIVVDILHWVQRQPRNFYIRPASSSSSSTADTTEEQKAEKKNGDTVGKNETKPQKKKAKTKRKKQVALPDGWTRWPIESRTFYPRVTLHRFGALMMSTMDPRSWGGNQPEHFIYEDHLDEGGGYGCAHSDVVMPLHKTLRHNRLFVFPGSGMNREAVNNEQAEIPDEIEPLSKRNERAMHGLDMNMTRAHHLTGRYIHPTRRHHSTSTIHIRAHKWKRNDVYAGQKITFQHQYLTSAISPTVFFVALGVGLDEIVPLVRSAARQHWYEDAFSRILLRMIARHPARVDCPEAAYLYIADHADKQEQDIEKKLMYGHEFVHQLHFLPQCGNSPAYRRDKAFEFARIIWQMLMKMVGFSFYDTKDQFHDQRYDTNGALWASMQRQVAAGKLLSTVDNNLRAALAMHQPLMWPLIIGEAKLSEQIAGCTSKGVWAAIRTYANNSRSGTTVQLKKTNWWIYASSVRRTTAPNKSNRKHASARQIDERQFSRECALRTPEGSMCGVVSELACGTTTSIASSRKVLEALLLRFVPARLFSRASDFRDADKPELVELDGACKWRTSSPGEFVQVVRRLRRAGFLSPYVGVHEEHGVVYIRTEPGRNMRPLLRLDGIGAMSPAAAARMSYGDLVSRGVVEFVDPLEEKTMSIAFSIADYLRRASSQPLNKNPPERFSHMELDPVNMMGVTAGSHPFSECNQAMRSVLACSMTMQSVSSIHNVYKLQPLAYQLHYPQRALASNRVVDDYDLHDVAVGHMVRFVIVMTDHTIEDSWEHSQTAIDRGMFLSSVVRRITSVIRPSTSASASATATATASAAGSNKAVQAQTSGKQERHERPGPRCLHMQDLNYGKLEADGLPLPGQILDSQDIVIGKTKTETKKVLNRQTGQEEWKTFVYDESVPMRDETGIVESTCKSTLDNGAQLVEVRLRSECLEEIGDKFSSRHGQKGTAGLNRPGVDMYRSVVDGRVAQVHMNPIGLLSRVTVGHIHEMHRSKAAALAGVSVNSTPFLSEGLLRKEIDAAAVLLAAGAHRLGYERHIDGRTGRMTQRPLFCGEIAHEKLVHMVSGKLHARNRGPYKPMTRQADDGRAKFGGLRFGQMEFDVCIALGIVNFLIERMKTFADAFTLPVCSQCNYPAAYNAESGYRFCYGCQDAEHVALISISFPNKLMAQEINFLHNFLRMILDDDTAGDNTTWMNISTKKRLENLEDLKPSLYRLSQVALPEPWEFAKYGIVEPVTMRNLLASLRTVGIPDPEYPLQALPIDVKPGPSASDADADAAIPPLPPLERASEEKKQRAPAKSRKRKATTSQTRKKR